jgi:hypothetical protein
MAAGAPSLSERRRTKSAPVRITMRAYKILKTEALIRGCHMSDVLESILPEKQGDTAGRCEFCAGLMRNHTRRHRDHAATCVLWKDRDSRDAAPRRA